MSKPIQAKAARVPHWLKHSEWCVETTSGLPQSFTVPCHPTIVMELVPVLSLGQIFVCSDFLCDLDLHQDMMLL